MIKVECVSCKSPYDVDERRIPPAGMKMRCPKCAASFVVGKDGAVRPATEPQPAPAPAPATASGKGLGFAAAAAGAPDAGTGALPRPPPTAASSAQSPPGPRVGGAASAFGSAAKPAGLGTKTLLGAALPAAAPPAGASPAVPAKPLTGTLHGVGASDLSDLPAVKPAAKPAVPWGSLLPPSPDAKPGAGARPTAGLPKGAMGVPAGPPLSAAGSAAGAPVKTTSTASAFGAGPPLKQTLLGGHSRGGASDLALSSSAQPAQVTDASAHELADPTPMEDGDLPFVDLPAPKPSAYNAFRSAEHSVNEPLVDLPVAKAKPAGKSAFGGSLMPPAANPAIDPLAAKPSGAKSTAFGSGPKPSLSEPRSTREPAPAPAAKAAFGAAPPAPPPTSGFGALSMPPPIQPDASYAPLELAAEESLELDMDAAEPEGFGELPEEPFAPELPTYPEFDGVDLPAPRAASPKLGLPKFGEPKPAAEPPMIDLPGPKPPKPAVAMSGAKALEPPPKLEPPMIDLPTPKIAAKPGAKFGEAPARAIEPPMINLPAPKPPKPMAAKPAAGKALEPLPQAGELPMIDLPALKATDLPALKRPANSDGGFGEVDLPMAKSAVDLPARRPSSASFDDLDLPAPKTITDLPAPVGISDLPAVVGISDLPAPRGIADLPAPMGVTDLPVGKGGFGDLDLPIPRVDSRATHEEASFGDLDLPDAPGGSGFGDIDLGGAHAASDDEASFGNLEIGSPLPTYSEDGRFDDLGTDALDAPRYDAGDLASLPHALRGDPADGGYGEVGLEAGSDEDMEFGIAEGEGFALPPEILRRQRGEELDTPVDKAKRVRNVLIGVALTLASIGGAGAALGFTDQGYFGMYFLEQYLPEAGDPKFAREAIARAEKDASSDTYADVRRSLVELGGARHKAGLNRELLTRSLLHESLYGVRFGADTASSARAAAILQRLEERHGVAPGMALARAGDAARRGTYGDAEARLAEARAATPTDPYVHLLAGEVALRQGKLADADKAFAAALKHGGAARAQWGLARVALARPEPDARAAQDSAVAATLTLSPRHAEARVAQSRSLFHAGNEERALHDLRQTLGMEPLDDVYLRASKPAKAEGYSLLGFIHEQRGRLHLARRAYDDALAADPYLIEALLGAGRVLLRERRFGDALARFESSLNLAQKTPNSVVLSGRKADVEARLGQARAELMLRRAPNAKATLGALLAEYPNDAEVVLAMGQAEEALNNRESAESLFKQSIELAPASFAGYLALAQYHFKLNQADKASEALNDAASKVEENAEMRRMLGQSELVRGRLDSAAHEFKRAIALDPQDLDARFGLGVSYRRAGQLEQARQLFDEIGARDPQFAGLTLERGQLLEAQGDYAKAAENYRAALDKDPGDTLLSLRLGAAQVEAGNLDDAEQTLDKVIHQTPNSADAEYYIGRIAFARGRGPDALTHFDRALALDGTMAIYHLYAARAALEMVNLGRTIEEAEAALARDPKLADAYWVRGIVRVRSGAVKDALKDGARALELNPKRHEAHALMAECYDELRQLPQAVEAYETALAAEPGRGEWWYKLGRVQIDRGARGAGNEALDRAIKLGDAADPAPYWLADAYRLLGESARATGDRRGAVAAFKRYLALASPGALDRAEVTKQLREWNVELER